MPASPFLFLGGALALDLVNTEVIIRHQRHDLLNTPDDVVVWMRAASQHHPELAGERWKASAELLESAKTLRVALRQTFELRVTGARLKAKDLEPLNHILQVGHHLLEVTKTGEMVSRYSAPEDSVERAMLPVALSARWVLVEAEPGRLHKCLNEHCILFFYDTTRSATRGWCSLGCLNRARSALVYQRGKQKRGTAA